MNENTENLTLAYRLFTDMQGNHLEYIYRGTFTQSITDNILALTESNLADQQENSQIKKRVFFIMVECLQNVTRHQEAANSSQLSEPGLFAIQRKGQRYFITTGNIIQNSSIEMVRKMLDKVNSLDKEELKKYHREILESGKLSEKGGAGLGLIEMVRKSGNKLSYEFKKLDENHSYFYFHTEVLHKDNEQLSLEELNTSLQSIIRLHEPLEKECILLNFSGIFRQESTSFLLSIIGQHIQGLSGFRKKNLNMMLEMLQNIIKHADSYILGNIAGNYGIFFISENAEEFLLTTGNYILNSKVKSLQERLDKINSYPVSELENVYRDTLSLETESSKTTGLGFIDMRIRTSKPLSFSFHNIDHQYSFFTLRIGVNKNLEIL